MILTSDVKRHLGIIRDRVRRAVVRRVDLVQVHGQAALPIAIVLAEDLLDAPQDRETIAVLKRLVKGIR